MLPLSPRLILLLTRRSQQEGRNLFVAYVGALCIQSGYNIVQDWINQLLEPSEKRVKNEPPPMSVPSPLPQQVGAPPDISAASRARLFGQFGPGTPTFSQPNPRPSQPSPAFMSGTTSPSFSNNGQFFPQPAGQPQPPPPPPTTKPPPLPPVPNQQISYLPLFNQTASQRRLGVEYTAQFFGPPHAGKWHVKCLGKLVPAATTLASIRVQAVFADDLVDLTTVNSIEKGQGAGPSKQLAKEEAAKQAFYAMGWAT